MPTLPADFQTKLAEEAIVQNLALTLDALNKAVSLLKTIGRDTDAHLLAQSTEHIRRIFLVYFLRDVIQ